jgi:maltokinase
MSTESLVVNEAEVIPQLQPILSKWLPSQRWFSSGETAPSSVSVVDHEILVSGPTTLLWLLLRIDDDATYQVPVGLGHESVVSGLLHGHDAFVIGHVDIDGVEHVAYDGLIDGSLSRPLFAQITNGEITAKSVRAMGAEQSNTSLIFDSRYVLKFIRRLYEGSNPDLEVTQVLTDAKFPNIAPVVATWQRDNYDLAVCQPYLWDGTDGWKLALGSARDFFRLDTQGASATVGSPTVRLDLTDPAQAGGDFADEACRLGKVTAQLHMALAQNFETQPFDVSVLVASLESSINELEGSQRSALEQLIAQVRALPARDTGMAIRVHGDYHLGQTLRSVNGWYIFDFEGEPARPLTERTKPASPFKDLAGMLRSFHYAAASAVYEQMESERESLAEASEAWESRNREAFKEGYLSIEGIDSILPTTNASARQVLLEAFEVEKAIYELAYERSHRPTWVPIPQAAIDRLLAL